MSGEIIIGGGIQKVDFRCYECGKVTQEPIDKDVVCCGRSMSQSGKVVEEGDEQRVDIVKIASYGYNPFGTHEHFPDVWEVWFLKPGRTNGERIGWFAKTTLAFKYKMVPGVRSVVAEGTAFTRNGIINKMISALAEG